MNYSFYIPLSHYTSVHLFSGSGRTLALGSHCTFPLTHHSGNGAGDKQDNNNGIIIIIIIIMVLRIIMDNMDNENNNNNNNM